MTQVKVSMSEILERNREEPQTDGGQSNKVYHCVTYPGLVEKTGKAVRNLGGLKKIGEDLKEGRHLQLNAEAGNRYHRSSWSAPVSLKDSSFQILIKCVRRKRRVKRSETGEETGQNMTEETYSAEVLGLLGTQQAFKVRSETGEETGQNMTEETYSAEVLGLLGTQQAFKVRSETGEETGQNMTEETYSAEVLGLLGTQQAFKVRSETGEETGQNMTEETYSAEVLGLLGTQQAFKVRSETGEETGQNMTEETYSAEVLGLLGTQQAFKVRSETGEETGQNMTEETYSAEVLGLLGTQQAFKVRSETGEETGQNMTEETYSAEVLGLLGTQQAFKSFADFQYLPIETVNSETGETLSVPKDLTDVVFPASMTEALDWLAEPGTAGKEAGHSSVAGLLAPPLVMARSWLPSTSLLRKEVAHRDPRTLESQLKGAGASCRKERKSTSFFMSGTAAHYPAAPNPEAVAHANERVHNTDVHARLEALFQERPAWTRNAILNQTGITDVSLKALIGKFAFYISSGPWARLWCRFGYDPRKDVSAIRFQTIRVELRKNAVIPARRRLRLGVQGTMATQRPNEMTKASWVYEKGSLPTFRQCFYCVCDILLPEVAEWAEGKGSVISVTDPMNGFLPPGGIERIRAAVVADCEVREWVEGKGSLPTFRQCFYCVCDFLYPEVAEWAEGKGSVISVTDPMNGFLPPGGIERIRAAVVADCEVREWVEGKGSLPTFRQCFYCVCDILLPEVAEWAEGKGSVISVTDPMNGFLPPGGIERIRAAVVADCEVREWVEGKGSLPTFRQCFYCVCDFLYPEVAEWAEGKGSVISVTDPMNGFLPPGGIERIRAAVVADCEVTEWVEGKGSLPTFRQCFYCVCDFLYPEVAEWAEGKGSVISVTDPMNGFLPPGGIERIRAAVVADCEVTEWVEGKGSLPTFRQCFYCVCDFLYPKVAEWAEGKGSVISVTDPMNGFLPPGGIERIRAAVVADCEVTEWVEGKGSLPTFRQCFYCVCDFLYPEVAEWAEGKGSVISVTDPMNGFLPPGGIERIRAAVVADCEVTEWVEGKGSLPTFRQCFYCVCDFLYPEVAEWAEGKGSVISVTDPMNGFLPPGGIERIRAAVVADCEVTEWVEGKGSLPTFRKCFYCVCDFLYPEVAEWAEGKGSVISVTDPMNGFLPPGGIERIRAAVVADCEVTEWVEGKGSLPTFRQCFYCVCDFLYPEVAEWAEGKGSVISVTDPMNGFLPPGGIERIRAAVVADCEVTEWVEGKGSLPTFRQCFYCVCDFLYPEVAEWAEGKGSVISVTDPMNGFLPPGGIERIRAAVVADCEVTEWVEGKGSLPTFRQCFYCVCDFLYPEVAEWAEGKGSVISVTDPMNGFLPPGGIERIRAAVVADCEVTEWVEGKGSLPTFRQCFYCVCDFLYPEVAEWAEGKGSVISVTDPMNGFLPPGGIERIRAAVVADCEVTEWVEGKGSLPTFRQCFYCVCDFLYPEVAEWAEGKGSVISVTDPMNGFLPPGGIERIRAAVVADCEVTEWVEGKGSLPTFRQCFYCVCDFLYPEVAEWAEGKGSVISVTDPMNGFLPPGGIERIRAAVVADCEVTEWVEGKGSLPTFRQCFYCVCDFLYPEVAEWAEGKGSVISVTDPMNGFLPPGGIERIRAAVVADCEVTEWVEGKGSLPTFRQCFYCVCDFLYPEVAEWAEGKGSVISVTDPMNGFLPPGGIERIRAAVVADCEVTEWVEGKGSLPTFRQCFYCVCDFLLPEVAEWAEGKGSIISGFLPPSDIKFYQSPPWGRTR